MLLRSLDRLLPGNGCDLSHFSQGPERLIEVESRKWYFFLPVFLNLEKGQELPVTRHDGKRLLGEVGGPCMFLN